MLGRRLLGINGLGRIGKLTLWDQLLRDHFDGYVINLGRRAGRSLEDVLDVIAHDSTYGPLERFLYGAAGERQLRVVDDNEGLLEVQHRPVRILQSTRNPKEIDWSRDGVRLVIDTTGAFRDPTQEASEPSLRGHLEAGAQLVLLSAPFKIKDKAKKKPADSTMLVYGINHQSFDPRMHRIVSSASCTTTGLAHMMAPLLERQETSGILTASMSTIHASTNTQRVLDSVPSANTKDLRRNRSVMNNIILSTTGAATALAEVLPAIGHIGFMADSVRIPTSTVSLINLNVTFHSGLDSDGKPLVTRQLINDIYRQAAGGPQKGLLVFSERQNVSSDLIGTRAAVVIEGYENHTRVGFMEVPPDLLGPLRVNEPVSLRIPVTHAKIFGWYDNEYGSYVFCMGELAAYLDRAMG